MSLEEQLDKKSQLAASQDLEKPKNIKEDRRYVTLAKIAHSPEVHHALNLFIQKIQNPDREITYDDVSDQVQVSVHEYPMTVEELEEKEATNVFILTFSYDDKKEMMTITWSNPPQIVSGGGSLGSGFTFPEKPGPEIILGNKGFSGKGGKKFKTEEELIDYLTDVISGLKTHSAR